MHYSCGLPTAPAGVQRAQVRVDGRGRGALGEGARAEGVDVAFALMLSRDPFYRRMAHVQIEADNSAERRSVMKLRTNEKTGIYVPRSSTLLSGRMCKVSIALAVFIALATPAAALDVPCTPTEVAVYQNEAPRVHVKCSTAQTDGNSSIWYWAIRITDAQWANRFISIATTALVSGRQLTIRYTPNDTNGAAWGCAAADCRTAVMIAIR